MKILESFGFVDIRATGDQKFGLAFLPNPNVILLRLWARKKQHEKGPLEPSSLAGLQDTTMSAFLERAIDVGANDVVDEHARLNKVARGESEKEKPAAKPKRRTRSKSGVPGK
ncbi:hypothetical protein ACLJYM_27325 [Rhizobium giardinii]|uniref:hypothetical protein n=1 Tax=Rhizobium giardinii TaxID=56731 RepID=UPI0013AF1D77